MDSPRGGITRESTHKVATLKTAKEWFSEAKESDLPLTVNQHTTTDGRIRAVIYNGSGDKVHTRG